MQKPKPKGIPKNFFIKPNEVESLGINADLVGLDINNWVDMKILTGIHTKRKRSMTAEASFKKWITSFAKLEKTYIRKPEVQAYAGKVSNFLKHSKETYLDIFMQSKNEAELNSLHYQQEAVSNISRKKIKLIESVVLSSELDQELNQVSQGFSALTNTSVDTSAGALTNTFIDTSADAPTSTPFSLSGDTPTSSSSDNVADVSGNAVDGFCPTDKVAKETKAKFKQILVKKRIFEEAKRIHVMYQRNIPITTSERKLMSTGLSGILDLVDESLDGQRKLFKEEWPFLHRYFLKTYKVPVEPISPPLKEKWAIASGTGKKKGLLLASKYLSTISSSPSLDDSTYETLKLFETVVDLVKNQSAILNPTHPDKVKENDYAFQLWLPIFKKLFAITSNTIRIKIGETAPKDSTNEKQAIYDDHTGKIIGFKIDMRFIYDHADEEFDIGAVEVSLPDCNVDKVNNDEGKLVREGRANTCSLYHVLKDEVDVRSWLVQLSGLKAIFSTEIYHGDHLFVAIPQFEITLPTCSNQLQIFSDSFSKLLSFGNDMVQTAQHLKSKLISVKIKHQKISKMSISSHCASPERKPTPCTVNWITPPRKDYASSIIPAINEVILNANSYTDFSSSDEETFNSGSDGDYWSEPEDEFGIKLTSKGWFASAIGVYTQCHPFQL